MKKVIYYFGTLTAALPLAASVSCTFNDTKQLLDKSFHVTLLDITKNTKYNVEITTNDFSIDNVPSDQYISNVKIIPTSLTDLDIIVELTNKNDKSTKEHVFKKSGFLEPDALSFINDIKNDKSNYAYDPGDQELKANYETALYNTNDKIRYIVKGDSLLHKYVKNGIFRIVNCNEPIKFDNLNFAINTVYDKQINELTFKYKLAYTGYEKNLKTALEPMFISKLNHW